MILKSNYTYSIIGCGDIANKHIFALKRLSHILTPQYCYDIDYSKGDNFSKIYNIEFDYSGKMVFGSDIVIIATPPYTHFKLVKEALKYNCFVICEKPLLFYNNFNDEKFNNIIKNERIFAVQQMRFHKLFMFLKNFRKDFYNFKIDISLRRGENYFKTEWRKNESLSGGIWGNQGFHILDFIFSIFDKPINIKRETLFENKDNPWYRKERLFFEFSSSLKRGDIVLEIQNEKESVGELYLTYKDNNIDRELKLSGAFFENIVYSNDLDLLKNIIDIENRDLLFEEAFNKLNSSYNSNFTIFDYKKNIENINYNSITDFLNRFRDYFNINSENWFYNFYFEIYNIIKKQKNVNISQISQKKPFFIDFILKSIYHNIEC
ncbi:Gfo/Idh/MocA family oxidoreductase [bacterium]|nr:Gfo/Idh/MocA family oxidoreductase [bacterium]